jgi:hypothetical protein
MHNGNYILAYLRNLSIRKTYLTPLRVSSFSSNVVDFRNKFQLLPLWESWSRQKLKRRKIFEKYCFWKVSLRTENVLKRWLEYTVNCIPLSPKKNYVILSMLLPMITIYCFYSAIGLIWIIIWSVLMWAVMKLEIMDTVYT